MHLPYDQKATTDAFDAKLLSNGCIVMGMTTELYDTCWL